MGLWSYILRLTLLVKGKQKKSRLTIEPICVIGEKAGDPCDRPLSTSQITYEAF